MTYKVALPKTLLLIIVAVLAIVLSATTTKAETRAALYDSWMPLTSERLMKMAVSNDENGMSSDTSLICYNIIVNRYDKDMKPKEKRLCAEACMKMWSIYFYKFYDFQKCFEHLTKAREISDEMGVLMPDIDLGFGCMYQTVSEENNNRDLGVKAMKYYRAAFMAAIKNKDDRHADMAFTNIVSMASSLNCLHSITDECNMYSKLPEDNDTKILRRYNKILYRVVNDIKRRNFEQALASTNEQLRMVEKSEYIRLVYFTCIMKTKILAEKGDLIGAIDCLQRPKQIATDADMKDCKLEVYGLLADYYKQLGQKTLYNDYRDKYLLLKDTLTNYHQVASVNEMEFQMQLKTMNDEMIGLKLRRQVQNVVVIVLVVFFVTVLIFMIILFRQNGRLRRSYLSLYRKNVDMLKVEEEERNMRKKYEEENKLAEEVKQAEDNVKYKNSNLNEDNKTDLMNRIMDVMRNSQDIYSAEFSVERLAQLTDSKYKYVSQIIHEKHNCNFNMFLNEYRIKEACKRIGDIENYGRLTIEAISASVGFKSRSTFITSFKHITGLTPSEYQRQAIKNREEE